jgi:hypothetical protein
MPRTRKTIELRVTVSCPLWVSRRQAKKEVRTRINQLCEYGYEGGPDHDWECIDENNFRARKVE